MIRTVKIDIHAENPSFPLQPVEVFEHSAASFTILNIPRAHGQREIRGVTVIVTDVDGVARGVAAVRNGSAWNVTIPETSIGRSGSVANGVMIAANGLDERGAVVPMWILGVGDLTVMRADGSVAPGEVRDTVHFFATAPANPSRGDIAPIEGVLKLFNGEEWMDIGGGSTGGGAIVLTLDSTGKKIFNGSVEITTYNDLLTLVRAGGVALMGSVGAQKDALFYPLYCEETAIRFDATGTLGSDIKTKSYTMQPINGKIRISEGSVVDLAKKSDIDALESRKLDIENASLDLIFATFKEGQQDNQAIVSEFTIPIKSFKATPVAYAFKIRAASSDAGEWDRSICATVETDFGSMVASMIKTEMIIGQWGEFIVGKFVLNMLETSSLTVKFWKDFNHTQPAKVRIALVSVDSSAGYSVKLSNGSTVYNFAPMFELIGAIPRDQAIDMLTLRRAEIGRIAALASNASQSQIIAKINELINLF